MAQNQLQRPSLGQWADLGALYDARTDNFVPHSLLPGRAPEAAINVTPFPSRQLQLLENDSFRAKLNNLRVSTEVGASFLSGMINVAGAAEYLKSSRLSNLTEQASIYYTINTVEERLSLGSPELRPYLTLDSIQGSGATHILVHIVWGAQSVVTIKQHLSHEQERDNFKGRLKNIYRSIEGTAASGTDVTAPFHDSNGHHGVAFDIAVFSDVISEPGQTNDLKQTVDFVLGLPTRAAEVHGGKGMPLAYTFVPLDFLSYTLGIAVTADPTFKQPSLQYVEDFQSLFDEVLENLRRLNDYHQELVKHAHCVPPDFINTVNQSQKRLRGAESSLQTTFCQALISVRSGRMDQSQMLESFQAARKSFAFNDNISNMMAKYRDKISFVNSTMASGINYLGYGATSIEAELNKHAIEDAYVLFFTDKARLESSSWDKNYRLLLQLLKDGTPNRLVAIVDCEANGRLTDREHISRFQNAKLVVPDVLDQILNGQCFARYIKEEYLDKGDAKKPLRRSAVKLACPGPRCDKGVAHDWICATCQVPIEYGPVDQHIYCDCGRSPYNNYGFKCKELEHGKLFERYDRSTLSQLLDSLDPLDELNILIIGETGVGKSTFINAFVNYLTHDTLDEAMQSEHLDSVIPCSFTVQSMDRSDPNGAITERRIKVGDDREEADGSQGQSATQKTTVYPVTYGDTVVRLIDTPGIGDTRGFDMDKQNMVNILSMLRYFDKLHGILFLLKSNSSRLTFMFRFVVEELLTHLHSDAALNMVFGFTNTRISNYMPGDTYGPLRALLEKHKQVRFVLSPSTIYCFDSESFRFLAAQKNGLTMDNVQDFRLSWDKSEKETKRLINHFRSLSPHFVRSTLSLNQTRELILQLTRPMADIMQEIDTTIQLNKDNINDLQDTRLRGDKLRGRLKWEKKEVETHPLDKPRTVCNDTDCKEFEDDGSGNMRPIYKSVCHEICWLENVPAETLSCPKLKNCAAFGGYEECRECQHRWENHLHIYYELTQVLREVDDEAVVELLAKNASDIALKEAAIDNLKMKIAESDYEYKEIQDAAVRFGLFLKKNSITPYNDAMLAYLDHLIKDEADKVQIAGGKRERLDNLLSHRREHVEQVKVLSQNMDGGGSKTVLDEAGVEALVDHLYKLKHWGKNLRDTKNKAEAAHLQAGYRERPYRPQARGSSSGSGRSGVFISNVVSGAINYLAGNVGTSIAISEQPRRPAAPSSRSPQPPRPPAPLRPPPPYPKHSSPSMPGTFPAVNATSNISTEPERQVLRKRPPIPAVSQPSPQPTMVVSRQHVPDAVARSETLKSRFLRPFSKRY